MVCLFPPRHPQAPCSPPSPTGDRLVGYVVSRHTEDARIDTGAILAELSHSLPDYMVPSQLMQLEALPLTPAGKVDRKALPAPAFAAERPHEAPEGEVETRISDQIAAGATYDQNSAQFAPKALFTRWTAKGGDPLEVTGTFHIADQSAEVDVKYEKLGSKFGVNFNSARSALITAARTSRDFSVEGRNVNVAPSYNFATGVSSVKSKSC